MDASAGDGPVDARAPLHPCFGRPGATFAYRSSALHGADPREDARAPPTLPVVLPDVSIYMLFAHRQWRAGMLLADLVYAGIVPCMGRTVLELGAGTGLPALTAAYCGAKKVLATDYDDDAILRALRDNMRRAMSANPARAHAPVSVFGHTWGQSVEDILDQVPGGGHVDVVLLADCVWERFSHEALLKSVCRVLAHSPNARVYMVAGFHTGRATLAQFFRRALSSGLALVPIEGASAWPPLSGCGAGAVDRAAGTHALPGQDFIVEVEVEGGLDEGHAADTHPRAAAPPPSATTPDAGTICASLSGRRRAFTLSDDDEVPVQHRNRWLTVSCFAWATV
ncbi:nicotinamide N-methyltransferase [Malassezia sp. CBS 17886]|nr:nicotinamide N-methyltransferase [Malassezia sp. CBS 17886]